MATDLLKAAADYASLEMCLQAARIQNDFAALLAAHKAAGTLTLELIDDEQARAMARLVATFSESTESRLARAMLMASGSQQ